MRILHTSDVHLGRSLTSLGTRAPAQQKRLVAAFDRVCEAVGQNHCDLLVVAGDLFDGPRVERSLVRQALSSIRSAGAPVVVIPGNHDAAATHPFLSEPLPPNLIFVPDEGGALLPQLDAQVHTHPVPHRDPDGPPLQIGLLHGSILDARTAGRTDGLDPQALGASKLDYIALGDWHSMRDFSAGGVPIWYSGAPEMVMPKQDLPGHALVVELGAGQAAITPVVTGECRRPGAGRRFDVALDEFEHIADLEKALESLAGQAVVAELDLRGRWRADEPLNIETLAASLENRFLYLDIADYSMKAVAGEIDGALARELAEWLGEQPMAEPVKQEALQLGLYLLRGGRI